LSLRKDDGDFIRFAGLSLLALVFAYVVYTESLWSRSLNKRRTIFDELGPRLSAALQSSTTLWASSTHTGERCCRLGQRPCVLTEPSNAGGGGERVLWTVIAHIQRGLEIGYYR